MITDWIASLIDNDVPDVPQQLAKAADTITGDKFQLEKKEQSVKKDAKSGLDVLEDDVTTIANVIEKDAEIALNFAERVGKDLLAVMKIGGNTAEFLITNYRVVLAVGAIYAGSRVYNEIKQTNLII